MNKPKGFTLIEIIISTTILSIISLFLFTMFQNSILLSKITLNSSSNDKLGNLKLLIAEEKIKNFVDQSLPHSMRIANIGNANCVQTQTFIRKEQVADTVSPVNKVPILYSESVKSPKVDRNSYDCPGGRRCDTYLTSWPSSELDAYNPSYFLDRTRMYDNLSTFDQTEYARIKKAEHLPLFTTEGTTILCMHESKLKIYRNGSIIGDVPLIENFTTITDIFAHDLNRKPFFKYVKTGSAGLLIINSQVTMNGNLSSYRFIRGVRNDL